jgi:hypothetical protein
MKKETVHVNSASELYCLLFFKWTVYQCTLFMLIALFSEQWN